MKLIAWLGNPGDQYKNNRHNAWFLILDDIVKDEFSGIFKYDTKYQADTCEVNIDGEKVMFVKPMTFMNRSGASIWAIANFYKIEPENVLVIHDEIDLPTWTVKLKFGWSHAGHNWLKDIFARLGTDKFWRIRLWVDRPASKEEVVDYVLWNLKKSEIESLQDKMPEIIWYIKDFVSK